MLRALERQRTLLGDHRPGTPILLRPSADVLLAEPPRKIKLIGDVDCPQCEARFQWTEKDGTFWKKHCLRCDYHWTIPVEYRDVAVSA